VANILGAIAKGAATAGELWLKSTIADQALENKHQRQMELADKEHEYRLTESDYEKDWKTGLAGTQHKWDLEASKATSAADRDELVYKEQNKIFDATNKFYLDAMGDTERQWEPGELEAYRTAYNDNQEKWKAHTLTYSSTYKPPTDKDQARKLFASAGGSRIKLEAMINKVEAMDGGSGVAKELKTMLSSLINSGGAAQASETTTTDPISIKDLKKKASVNPLKDITSPESIDKRRHEKAKRIIAKFSKPDALGVPEHSKDAAVQWLMNNRQYLRENKDKYGGLEGINAFIQKYAKEQGITLEQI
jgi:hypothetical protein